MSSTEYTERYITFKEEELRKKLLLLSDKNFTQNKIRADFICEVSLFSLNFCRQTKLIQLWEKVYTLANSNNTFIVLIPF